MKNKIKMLGLALLTMVIGVSNVFASESIIYDNTSYSVTSGGAVAVGNLSASYSVAKAMMSVDGATSGTKNTKFIAYKKQNGTLVKKATKITGFTVYACTLTTIGTVGSGNWTITNQAFDGATNYAGWNGELQYRSAS